MRRALGRTPLLVGSALSLSIACSGDFDDSRHRTEPIGTLGDDIYSTLCDRVGAAALKEDLGAVSYRGVCHRDQLGNYQDQVDESKLPPVSGQTAIVRKLAVAKLHAMARRRKDLIRAFDKTFSDEPVADPHNPGTSVGGHVALKTFLQRMVPLYESNPIDKDGSGAHEALMPSVTRATGRLFAALGGPGKKTDPQAQFGDPQKAKAAQDALSRLSGRLGYRPLRVALGAIKPSMAYPELRQLTQTFAPRLGPGGLMRDAFQNVLGATQDELSLSQQKPLPLPYSVDAATLQPIRPRSNIEVARAIMLATDPAFASPGAPQRFLVVRDSRGYAVPAGNTPGQPGSVSGYFSDIDNDGFADLDPLGRFVGPGGGLAQVDTPFFIPGLPRLMPPDPSGRAVDPAGNLIFAYLNSSETFVASTTRDLDPLLNPDPALESETLADLLSGAFALYGDPIQAPASWAAGGIYPSFDTSQSPMIDLLHATGWMFAHKHSDLHLKFVKELFQNHEPTMARLIGAALKVREISNQHPEAKLDPSVTIWDELQEIVVQTEKDPALFKDVLRALAHPDTQAYMGSSYSNYCKFKDKLTYDTDNLNAQPVNMTDASNAEPHVPPDVGQPDAGDNRSEFHRIMQIIHDVNGVNACNKEGARVRMQVFGLNLTWPVPPFSPYAECELFYFQNMGIFYLKSILQPSKAVLNVRPGTLNTLMKAAGVFADPNQMFEESTGINGMTLTPDAAALNRLTFFGAESNKFDPLFGGTMPDRDANWNGKNKITNDFIVASLDAVSTSVCPERLAPVPGATASEPAQLWLADCAAAGGDPNDVLRVRDVGTIFTWEKYDFYKGMRPLLKAFDDHDAGQIFLDSIEVLYRHWATEQHGPECNNNGNFADMPWKKYLAPGDEAAHKVNPAYNAKWCNGSGVSRYEPVLAEAFASDLLPALGELVTVVDQMTIHDDRNNADVQGLDILHEMTVAMMDADYAASIGMTDRTGNKVAKWANGQIAKPQLTMFDLFADALAKIDQKLPDGGSRRARWRRARSKLVDRFLNVTGEGPGATFDNQAFIKSVPILVDVIREQINANCADREKDPMPCHWATFYNEQWDPLKDPPDPPEFASKAAHTLRGPQFGTMMFLLDLINEDEEARRALEKHLRYLVQEASGNDALISMLASSADMMQLLGDDVNMPAIYNAVAVAAAPEAATENGKPAPGTADRVLELFDALTREPVVNGKPQLNPYDPYRVQDRVLANLVLPVDPKDPEGPAPIDIFLDTFAEVNRIDADLPREEPLSPDDLAVVFGSMRDFMTSKTRGMEQFYEIVRHRNGN